MTKFLSIMKRGDNFLKNHKASHVGMILSFAIFVTFLVFLYVVVEPVIKTQEDKNFLVKSLEPELLEKFSDNMTSISIKISGAINPNKDCLKIHNFVGEVTNESNLVIKNKTGGVLGYSVQGVDLTVGTGTSFDGFLKIYYSDGIVQSPSFTGTGCDLIQEVSVGAIITDKYIFSNKITWVINEYETNYENLKKELNIPERNDFGFDFTYSNKSKIGTGVGEISGNVYAEDIPVQYVDKDANILSGVINLRIW